MTKTDLTARVAALINEVETTHRYSMSRIYGLYNEAFDTHEKPQSCASCLIRKVRELKVWLDNAKKVEAVIGKDDDEDNDHIDHQANEPKEPKAKRTTRKKRDDGAEKD